MSMDVTICDARMGLGKTSAAITEMNVNTAKNYMFITPYLREVDRIINSCASRDFCSPSGEKTNKLKDLQRLLAKKRCIASTHNLFLRCHSQPQVAELIREGHYTLILDEVMDAIQNTKIAPVILKALVDSGTIQVDAMSGKISCDIPAEECEGPYENALLTAKSGNAFVFEDSVMYWVYPPEIFEAFDEIIILTYMFESQLLKHYFDLWGATYRNVGVRKYRNTYQFCEGIPTNELLLGVSKLIHVCEDEELNEVGEYEKAFSVGWYERQNKMSISNVRERIQKFFVRVRASPVEHNLWTTFSKFEKRLSGELRGEGRKYAPGHLAFNTRATNDYREYRNLAFCVNVYRDPRLVAFLANRGIEVDEDAYALSTLLQWIWRSAIRDGHEIWIYIPSSRMRGLLKTWIGEVDKGELGDSG